MSYIETNTDGDVFAPGAWVKGHNANCNMAKVSTSSGPIRDCQVSERVLQLGGFRADEAALVAGQLNGVPGDPYEIAAALVKLRGFKGLEALKLSGAQFEQIRIYQRVRARYHG